MVINFRARGISHGVRKLTRTPMLIIIKKTKRKVVFNNVKHCNFRFICNVNIILPLSTKIIVLAIKDNIVFLYFLHSKLTCLFLKVRNIKLMSRGCLDFSLFKIW